MRLLCILLVLWATRTCEAANVELVPATFGGASQPQVAVSPAGHIHVVFGREDSLYYTGSTNQAGAFSSPVRVGRLPKLALGLRRGPRICASDKVLAISAISLQDGDLHIWTSHDGGVTWKEGAPLNNVRYSAREGLHGMASDGQGHLIATWLDLRRSGTELWGATSDNGGETWMTNKPIYRSPDGHICECCHPSVAMDAQGHTAVMWRNWLGGSRDLYAAVSQDFGRNFASPERLGQGTWKLDACPMDGGAIAVSDEGAIDAIWRRAGDVFTSRRGEAEVEIAKEATQPIVVRGKMNLVEFWEANGNLMMRRNDDAPLCLASQARFPSAAALPAGGTIVTWESHATKPVSILYSVVP